MQKIQWMKEVGALSEAPTSSTLAWLTKPYILSKALEQHCKRLSVNVLSQTFGELKADEINCFSEKDEAFWIRQVFLEGDGIPWTFGRVVAPRATYDNTPELKTLGHQPLGETLLYGNPHVTRSGFEYAVFWWEQYQEKVWARRSLFTIKQFPLLVSEVLLPALPDYD